jgi:hypothetical protein
MQTQGGRARSPRAVIGVPVRRVDAGAPLVHGGWREIGGHEAGAPGLPVARKPSIGGGRHPAVEVAVAAAGTLARHEAAPAHADKLVS